MRIIANGRAQATVIIPKAASETNAFAAEELVKYLEKMSGVKLIIYTDDYKQEIAPECCEICIGPVERPMRPEAGALKNDGYSLKTVGSKLFIQGENDRALMYGVYGLLERVLGCRFFTAEVEKVPTRRVIDLPQLDREVVSPFEYRETTWACYFDPDIAVKRGLNGHRHGSDKKRGGFISYNGFVHTFDRDYIPVKEYFDEHPEYFSMVDGKRISDHTQLCLTNPDVFRIVRDKLRAKIEETPEATIFSVSQNDWYNPCQCPECAKIDEEEGSYMGTLLRFINALARDVAKDYPHVIIDTLAYQYTRQAPKITKPEPNVAIRICTIEACFTHPLGECDFVASQFRGKVPGDALLADDFAAWSKICRRVHVWDYTTEFRHYLLPFADFRVLQDNVKFFIKNGVTGLFEQGNRESVSGECGDLRAYLISRLFWDPDMDVARETEEFLSAVYGSAGACIGKYLNLIADNAEKTNLHMGIFEAPDCGVMPEWLMDEADALFDEAERLADDEDVLYRVQCARMAVRYCRLWQMKPDDPTRKPVLDAFVDDLHRFGFLRIREACPLETSIQRLYDDPEHTGRW